MYQPLYGKTGQEWFSAGGIGGGSDPGGVDNGIGIHPVAVTGAAGGQSLAGLESSLAGRDAIELKMKGVIRRTSDMSNLLAKRADEGFYIQLDHRALIHSGG